MLYFQDLTSLPDERHEPLRERPPAQVLEAVAPHRPPAPPPHLPRKPQIIRQGASEIVLEAVHADVQVERQTPADDLASLPEARVVSDERDDAAGSELRRHEPEGLWEDGGHHAHVRRRHEPHE